LYKKITAQPWRKLDIYSKFLETFVRRGIDIYYVHNIYALMRKNFKQLTPEIYELLMRAFVNSPDEIARLYHEMYTNGIAINDSIHKYLLQAFDNVPKYLPVVTKIKEMQQNIKTM
jgi:protein-tyrosine phosphatase